jgi:uncharacterized protein (TIGR03437 family)
MPKMMIEAVLLGVLLGGISLSAQTTCGNVQLQLASDYSFAIGSSSGGSAYAFTLGGKPLALGSLTQLALFHYDSSLTSTSGIAPLKSAGTSLIPGRWGSAVAIAPGGNLSYPASGNISFTDGTIELWIAPTKDGTDPIYSRYDHTLFRYMAANGDQLVLSESASGNSFYAGTTIGGTFTGTVGVQMASLKAGAWHHVAFTYSKTGQRLRFYLDGSLISENDATFSLPASGGTSFTVDSDSDGNASAFLVDDLRISSDEETAAQIQYDARRSTPFADHEVLLPLAGVSSGQLNYSVTGCGAASYSWTGIPITNLNPPSNLLPPGATSVTLSFNTLQPSSCAYSVGSLMPFSSMQAISAGQKTTSHQGTIVGISSSPLVVNTVYLQCDSNPGFVESLQYRAVGSPSGPFPRIGSIWQGEYILNTKPDQAAKIQVYFGPDGMTASQATALRAQNPNVLILPGVNAQETTDGSPAVAADYFLRDVNGSPIEDWPGDFLLNLTKPEVATFLAQFAFQQYFTQANLAFDGIFWDNFNTTIDTPYYDYKGIAHQIDANGDGVADDPAILNAAWSHGISSLISTFNQLAPSAYVAAHNALPTAANLPHFNGNSFTSDAPQVREGTESFTSMLDRYDRWFAGGRQPVVSTIQSAPPSQIAYGYGYNPLKYVSPSTLQFSQTYYPNMRFGLATALMNDGFSLFDFGDSAAPVNWWYDEFDFNLGQPVSAAALLSPGSGTSQLSNGGFENSLSGWALLVSGDGAARATVELDTTVAAHGNSSAVIHVTKPGTMPSHVNLEQDNISLKSGTNYKVQFWARSDTPRTITVFSQGGAPNYPGYGLSVPIALTSTWQFFTASFVAPTTANDGRLEFWVGDQAGSVWLDDVTLFSFEANLYRRDYSNGIVLLNGTSDRKTIPVESGFVRFSGSQVPLWQYIVDDAGADFIGDTSWQLMKYDTGVYGAGNYMPPFYHAWNGTAHLQSTSGTAARWNLNIPADGMYTLQVWLPAAPGASGWTKSAIYEVVSNGATVATYTLDQTTAAAGDGWHTIATVSLTVAGAPFLRVHNGGSAPLLADGVYVTSAALFNDGSVVSQVNLGPYDGILLRRQNPIPARASRVNSVLNAASFQPAVSSGGFVSIMGTGFGTSSHSWTTSDFSGINLPTSLDGISVTINGHPAYVEYISPTQVNVIAPDDDAIGQVQVQVLTRQGTSYAGTVTKLKLSPAFFTYPSGTTSYAVAVHLDGSLVGPSGPSSRPAVPGEVIQIYGTGFGATNPAKPASQLVSQPAPLVAPVTVSIGGINAAVQWVGLVSSGLYQLNVIVPMIATGDQTVQMTISGFQSPSGVFLPVSPN